MNSQPSRLKSVSTCLFLAACCLGMDSAIPAEEQSPAPVVREETWQVILMSGQRVGYARSLVEPLEKEGEQLVRSVVETHMTIKRFGQKLRISTSLNTEETLQGDLRRFTFEMANPPAGTTRTTGVVSEEELTVETEIAGRTVTNTKKWDPSAKSPVYQDRVLKNKPLKPGETQSFPAYMPEFGKLATINMTAIQEESVKLWDDTSVNALKVRITQSLIPGMATFAWLSPTGETLKSATKAIGSDIVTYTVSREEALKVVEIQELDLAVNTLIKVPAIPEIFALKSLTYRISLPDQDPSEFIVADAIQAIKKLDDHTLELTVKKTPIPTTVESSTSPGDEFLQSTDYLQTEDANVQRHAEKATGTLTNPPDIARAMEKYVRDTLDKKNFSTALASAAEVAANLEGDCTEHAMLLAAMLRVKKIPSRLAVGLVYVELNQQPCFGGHMWTEAWLNGQWIPLDGTLGRGGAGCGHIKLGHFSLAGEQATPIGTFAPLMLAIGSMRIEVLSAQK